MIGLRNNLPVIEFDNGCAVALEPCWFQRSIMTSARRAGYENWWLSEHVTKSILRYLINDYYRPSINSDNLSRSIRSVLVSIGFSDIAEVFRLCPPPVRLSLVQIVVEAGAGYELLFFRILSNRLGEIFNSTVDHLEISGLKYCVKTLMSACYWKSSCSVLRDEIVAFIHSEVSSKNKVNDLNLQLS